MLLQAALRFETEGSASVALDKAKDANEGKISINGGEVEYNVLEGLFTCCACCFTLQEVARIILYAVSFYLEQPCKFYLVSM